MTSGVLCMCFLDIVDTVCISISKTVMQGTKSSRGIRSLLCKRLRATGFSATHRKAHWQRVVSHGSQPLRRRNVRLRLAEMSTTIWKDDKGRLLLSIMYLYEAGFAPCSSTKQQSARACIQSRGETCCFTDPGRKGVCNKTMPFLLLLFFVCFRNVVAFHYNYCLC